MVLYALAYLRCRQSWPKLDPIGLALMLALILGAVLFIALKSQPLTVLTSLGLLCGVGLAYCIHAPLVAEYKSSARSRANTLEFDTSSPSMPADGDFVSYLDRREGSGSGSHLPFPEESRQRTNRDIPESGDSTEAFPIREMSLLNYPALSDEELARQAQDFNGQSGDARIPSGRGA